MASLGILIPTSLQKDHVRLVHPIVGELVAGRIPFKNLTKGGHGFGILALRIICLPHNIEGTRIFHPVVYKLLADADRPIQELVWKRIIKNELGILVTLTMMKG